VLVGGIIVLFVFFQMKLQKKQRAIPIGENVPTMSSL
jgi:NADH:ubiquinone oxidoreductase subunit 6 (subunit J)